MIKNMHLISSKWGGKPTFKMIPISIDCPYNEILFDPNAKALAIVSKEKKETFHMVPRLTETGEKVTLKPGKIKTDGKNYAEQRVTLETYYEYYIENEHEIVEFVEKFANNADVYDYSTIIKTAFGTLKAIA